MNSQNAADGGSLITADVTNSGGIDIQGASLSLSYLNITTGNMDPIGQPITVPDLAPRDSVQIPNSWQTVTDAVYDGQTLVVGTVDPPTGMQLYSSQNTSYTLMITVPPLAVIAFSPTNGQQNVDSISTFELDFNDLVTAGSGMVTLVPTGGGASVTITTSCSGNILTITPGAPMAYGTQYTLTVTKNAVAVQDAVQWRETL